MTIDLVNVVVVNESSDPDKAGDVELFKNIAHAESYLEPIDVLNEEYFAYFLDGSELRLLVVPERKLFTKIDCVRIEPVPAAQKNGDRVRLLLKHAAAAVQVAQKHRKGIEPKLKPAQMPIAELVELIGFPK